MKINTEIIKALDPCKPRFDNYLKYYSKFDGTLDEFLDLTDITYDDKIWVSRRLLNKNQLVHFAVLCAESVLNIYESRFSNDNRIKDCLSFMKTIVDFSNLTNKQREKLLVLRKNAADAADAAYAAAAAYAATYAAYAAAYAADAAAAAAAADANAADAAAAYAATYAAYAQKNQQDLNLQFLKIAASL